MAGYCESTDAALSENGLCLLSIIAERMGINLEAGKCKTLSGSGMLSFTMTYDTAVWAKLADKALYSWVRALQIFQVVAPFKRAVCELVGAFL